MKLQNRVLCSIAAFGLVLIASQALAAAISVHVFDASGQPVVDSVVYAESMSSQPTVKSSHSTEIEQKKRKFMPLVTAVQVGTEISFPNHDTVRHHVYSFSQPKIFDIKIYSGVPASPVLFDKPGTVVIGCNIHDQMVAYIYVVNTSHFAKTDANGIVKLEGLQPGKYRLKAWHFNLPSDAAIPEQTISLAGSDMPASFNLNIKSGATGN